MKFNDFLSLIPDKFKQENKDSITIEGDGSIIQINEQREVNSGEYNKSVIFSNLSFDKRVFINGGTFGSFTLESNVINISIVGGVFTNLYIKCPLEEVSGVKCDYFHCHQNISVSRINAQHFIVDFDKYCKIKSCTLPHIVVFNVGNELIIEDTNIGDISIYAFTNIDYRLTLSSINPIANVKRKFGFTLDSATCLSLDISYSNLSNHDLILGKTKINEIKSIFSKLFGNIYHMGGAGRNKEQYRDGYRQLKVAMINQHDKINELYYKSKELNANLSELHWWKNFRTWFVLGVSKITNNFGLDWFISLLWIIGIGGILFPLYCYTIPGTQLKGAGDLIMFMNPTHAFDFLVPSDQLTQWAKAIDIVTRILIGFFIYQFIAAFRKFVR